MTTTFARRVVALTAAFALGAYGIGGLALPAMADTSPVDPTDPATPVTVSADALPTVQIDGVVWSQTTVGNIVYAGGDFQTARNAGTAVGDASQVARTDLLAYDITTGKLVTSFNHTFDGPVRGVTQSPDGTRVYVTGDFQHVDGQWRVRVAAFDTSTGALISTFRPTLASSGLAIAATNSTVYVGGNFTSVAGVTGGTLVPHAYLAAFNASDGSVTSFQGDANAPVTALAVTFDGGKVVAGGRFTTLAGATVPGLGAVDPVTGASSSFPANQYVGDSGTGAAIDSLYADSTGVYGSGYNYGGTGNLEGAFRADPSTGALVWVADCHGDTYSVFPSGSALYTVSHQHYCGVINGFPQTNPWTFHHATAFSVAATQVNNANTLGYPSHAGQPAPSLLNWYPNFTVGTYTGQGQAGWSVSGTSDYISIGGEFPAVNGQPQYGLVRFAVPSKAPNKVGPSQYALGPAQPGTNLVASANSFLKGQVRVSFQTTWDPDNMTLNYKVYRGSTAISTEDITAPYWAAQSRVVTDTGLTPGSTVNYRVVATDPFGNTKSTAVMPVTVASADASPYATAVLGDNPTSLWRMGEPAGSTIINDWAGSDTGTAGTGVTLGTAGAINGDPNTAATFSGDSTGLVSTAQSLAGPQVFSVEAWFKTTSTAGGKIVGFGDQPTGNSSNYDRHLYMLTSGKVVFGVYPGSMQTVTSSQALNDGNWHYAVGTLGPDGQRLYIDGKLAGTNSGATSAQAYNGYWRIGGDVSWSGANYFAGSIDDVAVYPTELSYQQVDAHWVASGRTSNLPVAPTDAYGNAVFTAGPEIYWRLDDTSGSTAKDSGPLADNGTYYGSVTQGVAGALTGGVGTAVTFLRPASGQHGMVSANAADVNPQVYSEELWFNTTTTKGGKLIGFGSSRTGTSSNYDRHVYMTTDGRLNFGAYTGTTNVVTSPLAYNDGKWHYMVATQGPAGMALYVDGQLVGSNSVTGNQNYTGYWRIAGDSTWSGDPWFDGTLDEVAIYQSVLTPQQVAQHWSLGSGSVAPNQPPVSSFTATATGLSVGFASTSTDPDATIASTAWDFGDGSTSTQASPTHVYAAAGTYTVTLTVTDNLGATNASSQQVTVVAPNQPPVSSFTATATGLSVAFASTSTDPDGTIASTAWDFGDGSSSTQASPTHVYAAAGTYTVTLTVTDNLGATNASSQSVTVTAPVGPVTLAADSFARTVTAGWGSADQGGAWTVAGSASVFSVNGTVGKIAVPAGQTDTASLASVSSTSTDVTAVLGIDQMPSVGSLYALVQARQVSSSSGYGARVLFTSAGRIQLYLTGGGNATYLAGGQLPSTVTYAAGDQFNVRVVVDGVSPTTVEAKVWKVGTTEPTAWTYTATDSTASLQVAGWIGFQGYLSASAVGPVALSVDNLVATTKQ